MNFELGSLMWAQIWQVTLLAMAVWGAVRCFATDRPHLAHALWLLVLIKCLTPPVLASPTSPFSWLQSRHQDLGTTQSDVAISNQHAISQFGNPNSIIIRTNQFQGNEIDEKLLKSELTTSNSFPNETHGSLSSQIISSQTGFPGWPIILAAFWLVGAVINLIVTSVRFLLFWRSTKLSQVIAQPKLEQTVDQWSRELGIRQRVRIRVLDSPIGPAVLGIFRPMILLPLVLVEGRNENDLKPLLTHELIHIRRGDLFWAMIQTLAGCLFWFHPMVRWVVRMVTQESERSCDEETVANLGCSPRTYAKCLLEVLELKQSLRVAPAVPGIRPVDITSNRMERIMRLGHGCQKRTPFWVWLVMLVSGSIVLPGAALVLGQDEVESTEAKLIPLLNSSQVPEVDQDKQESWKVETYDVADLLKKAENIIDDAKANSETETPDQSHFQRIKQFSTPSQIVMSRLPAQDQQKSLQTVETAGEPNFKIFGKTLYVYGSDEFHQKVTASLKQMQEIGFKNIVVETFLVSADSETIEKSGLKWNPTAPGENGTLAIATETFGAITTMSDVKFDPATIVDSDFKQASHEISLEATVEGYAGSFPGLNLTYPNLDQVCGDSVEPQKDNARPINALQRTQNLKYLIRSNEGIETLVEQLKTSSATRIKQYPTITCSSGQGGTIVDGASRPFVVGVHRLKPDSKQLQPEIGIVCCGRISQICPTLQSDGSIRLKSQYVVAELDEVRTVKLDGPWKTEEKRDTVIQLPIVSFVGFNSDIEIPKDHTLILNTRLPDAERSDKRPDLVIIRCRAIDESGYTISYKALPGNSDQSLLKLNDTTNAGTPEYFLKPVDSPEKDVNRTIVISSTNAKPDQKFQPVIEQLDNLELRLETKVEHVKRGDGVLLRGEQLKIRIMDDIELSCEKHAELEFMNENQFTYRGQGCLMFNGLELRADHIQLNRSQDRFGIKLQGNARCFLEDKSELKADKINILLSGGAVFLEGNACVDRKDEAALQAAHIKILDSLILLEGKARLEYLDEPRQDQKLNGNIILYATDGKEGSVIEP